MIPIAKASVGDKSKFTKQENSKVQTLKSVSSGNFLAVLKSFCTVETANLPLIWILSILNFRVITAKDSRRVKYRYWYRYRYENTPQVRSTESLTQ